MIMSPFMTESVSIILTNCQANHCCISNLTDTGIRCISLNSILEMIGN